jgi:hypothetical protein
MTISGIVVRYDLGKETYEFVDWTEEDRAKHDGVSLRRLIGGIGFAFEESLEKRPCTDPSTKFVVNTGFLTGLPRHGVPNGCTRTYVSFNSPIKEKDGFFGISYAAAGGLAGPHIKSCGIDGIILEGESRDTVGVMVDCSGGSGRVLRGRIPGKRCGGPRRLQGREILQRNGQLHASRPRSGGRKGRPGPGPCGNERQGHRLQRRQEQSPATEARR